SAALSAPLSAHHAKGGVFVGQTFDVYVSPTGSDANPGTLSQPWAISSLSLKVANAHNVANCLSTAGKRVGLIGDQGTFYLTTAFTGSISSGSNQMTISGVSSQVTQGMALVSGLGSAYTRNSLGRGPTISSIAGNVLTLSSNAAATLTNATIVATFMVTDPAVGALALVGSTNALSPTYWGSSNSSGFETARLALLDAEGGSGVYGGFISNSVSTESGAVIAHTGQFPTPYTVGNAKVSGIRIRGWSYRGIRIGGHSSGDGPSGISGVVLQNNEMFEGNASANSQDDNCFAMWIDCTTGALISNNWIHDCIGINPGSMDHLNAIIIWGAFGTHDFNTSGTIIEKNTCVNAGNIYGKEACIEATTVRLNYIDVSMFSQSSGVQDFTGQTFASLTGTTLIEKNVIVIKSGGATSLEALSGLPTQTSTSGTWVTPAIFRNNTVNNVSGATLGVILAVMSVATGSSGVGGIQFYGNVYANPAGATGSLNSDGNVRINPQAAAVMDYNLYPGGANQMTWALSGNASPGTATSFTSASAFATALASAGGISNAEAHTLLGSPTFTGTGLNASKYKLSPGSLGQGTGSSDGTISGTPCDMGAWTTGVTQIGCDFAI